MRMSSFETEMPVLIFLRALGRRQWTIEPTEELLRFSIKLEKRNGFPDELIASVLRNIPTVNSKKLL